MGSFCATIQCHVVSTGTSILWTKFSDQVYIGEKNIYNGELKRFNHLSIYSRRNLKTENMQYLKVEQALADAAYFIQEMNKAYNFTSDQKWIAFGGSYGGALVVWMRVRYPNLVYGGISSSGPIAPVVNFKSKITLSRRFHARYISICVESFQNICTRFRTVSKSSRIHVQIR